MGIGVWDVAVLDPAPETLTAGIGSGNASTSARNHSQRPDLKPPQGSILVRAALPRRTPSRRRTHASHDHWSGPRPPPGPCRTGWRRPAPRRSEWSGSSPPPSGSAVPVSIIAIFRPGNRENVLLSSDYVPLRLCPIKWKANLSAWLVVAEYGNAPGGEQLARGGEVRSTRRKEESIVGLQRQGWNTGYVLLTGLDHQQIAECVDT